MIEAHPVMAAAKFNDKLWGGILRNSQVEVIVSGELLVALGEYVNRVGLVLGGRLATRRVDADGEDVFLGHIQKGEFFGELGVISNLPAESRVTVEHDATICWLPEALFRALRDKNKPFKAAIDEVYRSRVLGLLLRSSPLLKVLTLDQLEALKEKATVEVHEHDKRGGKHSVIAKAGDPIDRLCLVRSGAIECRLPGETSQRVLGFFNSNSSFGEGVLATSEQVWNGEYRTLARTEMITISREAFEECLDSETLDMLNVLADDLAGAEEGRSSRFLSTLGKQGAERGPGIIAGLEAGSEPVKGGKALVIHLGRCTRCNACVESCVAVHEDGIPRISKAGFRGKDKEKSSVILASACYNCDLPDCMAACNFGAIRRDMTGDIKFLWENCTGCTLCVPACPYDVIRMTHPQDDFSATDVAKDAGVRQSWLGKLAGLMGKKSPVAAEPVEEEAAEVEEMRAAYSDQVVRGKAVKCDRCEGLPFEACVYNCPCGAIERRDPGDIFALFNSSTK